MWEAGAFAALWGWCLWYCWWLLRWMLLNGLPLCDSAWQARLAQKLLPHYTKSFLYAGLAPQEAAATAARAAALLAKNLSALEIVRYGLLACIVCFVMAVRAISRFVAARRALRKLRRSERAQARAPAKDHLIWLF